MDRESYQILRRLEEAKGQMNYHLHVFGDHLAQREGYKEHSGIEAVQFYLCKTYGWLPSVVKAMSFEDMRFMLEEEMKGWTVPPEAR